MKNNNNGQVSKGSLKKADCIGKERKADYMDLVRMESIVGRLILVKGKAIDLVTLFQK